MLPVTLRERQLPETRNTDILGFSVFQYLWFSYLHCFRFPPKERPPNCACSVSTTVCTFSQSWEPCSTPDMQRVQSFRNLSPFWQKISVQTQCRICLAPARPASKVLDLQSCATPYKVPYLPTCCKRFCQYDAASFLLLPFRFASFSPSDTYPFDASAPDIPFSATTHSHLHLLTLLYPHLPP